MAIEIRELAPLDADAVARLHAESWRTTYRGMLRDGYLEGPVLEEHRSLWRGRVAQPPPRAIGLVASDACAVVGFLYAFAEHDDEHGAYLDNLHVRPGRRARGIGSKLLLGLSERLLAAGGDTGLYLWAYEDNVRTRRYYERLGAVAEERAVNEAPGGGQVPEWRYRWPSVSALRETLLG